MLSLILRGPCANRGSGLEAHADAKLYLPRVVDLSIEGAPIPGVAKLQDGVEQLVMVEDVRKDGAELHAEALRNHDVLLDAEVHVPEGLTAEIARTAVMPIVETQDWVAEQL